MALDPRFVIASDIEQFYVDKDTGQPLANGTLSFYSDTARNLPKQVFELSGAPPNYTYTSMGTVITLSAVGTVQDSGNNNEVIYWYPYDDQGDIELYYVEVRNSQGTIQFTREAWPNVTDASGPDPTTTSNGNFENQIANPTFTNVFLNPGIANTFTVTAASSEVFPLGPDWDFVISGTGTVTVQQIPLSGSQNVVTSPPYVLDINISTGITTCYLRQRFIDNSGVWTTTGDDTIYLYASFVAQNMLTGTAMIPMIYAESSGNVPLTIFTASFGTPYELVSGYTAMPVPASTNTSTGFAAYSDIYLSFPGPSHTQISSIQLIPTTVDPMTLETVPYDINSSNRDEAFQGSYYIPRLNQKRINSFLTGWDFPLNPYQFGNTGTITTVPTYIADQTIAACGTTGNVIWQTDLTTGGIEFGPQGTNDSFYIQQYLSQQDVYNMMISRLSVNTFAYQNDSNTPVVMKIYLFSAPISATVPALPTPLGTIDATGNFTLTAAGWTAIPRSNLPIPQFTLNKVTTNSDINNGKNDFGFSEWEITDASQISNSQFSIVVTFQYAVAGTKLTVNSISCVPGDLPCRPAIKTFEQTLLDCQYYYEKSYELNVPAPAVTFVGSIIADQTVIVTPGAGGLDVAVKAYPSYIKLNYKTIKRIAITPNIYSLAGSVDNVLFVFFMGTTSSTPTNLLIANYWGITDLGNQGCSFTPIPANRNNTFYSNASVVVENFEAVVHFQYVADARLGIV